MALAQWLSLLEPCPVHQKVVCSISSQGTNLGCRYSPVIEPQTYEVLKHF